MKIPNVILQHISENNKCGSEVPLMRLSEKLIKELNSIYTEVLKVLHFDGIRDLGGKHGGQEYRVWIPFYEWQVKSATGNVGTFDIHNNNMLY